MTKLSPHFTVEEFTTSETAARKGINNIPPKDSREYANLGRLARTMEDVRKVLDNKPVLISSGYRSKEVNKAVGGSKTSVHMQGLACDFICPGFGTPYEICKKLEPEMTWLEIDQLILEFDTWVHLGLSAHVNFARHMAMTINKKGTKRGFSL